MNRVAFNSIIIIVCILAIVTIAVVIPIEFKKCVDKYHRVIQIIAIILSVIILVFMLLSLDYTGTPCVAGRIIDIKILGSFAGIYDRYQVIIIDIKGITHEIQSVFPVYGHTSSLIKNINTGDYCELFGSTLIDAFFYSINKVS